MELHLGIDEEPTDITDGVCYRPPDQEDQVDEALYRQIGAVSYYKPWSSWGTSIIPISVGGATQQALRSE